MAGASLTATSRLQCPHGGQVQIVPADTRSRAGGAPLATASGQFLVTGCPFQLPGPTPSPCVQVIWQVPDTRVRAGGGFTLSQSSVGLCMSAAGAPQGPVVIVSTQTRTQTR